MDRSKWEYKMFEDCIEKSKKTRQLMTSDYQSEGLYPIISQESSLISGYTNDFDFVNHFNSPVVIFGDHTRVLKYVDFDFAVGADGVKILIPKNGLNAKFLLNYLLWYKVPNLGYSRHYKLLKDISVPFPPIADQQRIVAELDCLNEMIALKQEQLKEFDKLAQSIFYDMFGDPVTNVTNRIYSLGELIEDIKYGASTPPSFSKSGYKFIRATNIKNGGIIEDNMMYIDVAEATKIEKCKLSNKDLIIVRSGVNAGDVCRIGDEYAGQYAGYDIIISAQIDKINTVYLNCVLNNNRYIEIVIKPMTRRAAQPHLNAQQVKSMPIPLPPLSLQQQFAEKIAAIEAQKELVKQSIAETQKLLDYTMDKYFGFD